MVYIRNLLNHLNIDYTINKLAYNETVTSELYKFEESNISSETTTNINNEYQEKKISKKKIDIKSDAFNYLAHFADFLSCHSASLLLQRKREKNELAKIKLNKFHYICFVNIHSETIENIARSVSSNNVSGLI